MKSSFKPKISVALGTFNGAQFIHEQLQSIIDQTVPVDEIILSDDASSDNTVEIARAILEESRLTFSIFAHHSNLGVRDNFAYALSQTTGDIVFLCDQDDIWDRQKVEKMLPFFPKNLLVHTDAALIDSRGHPLNKTLLEELHVSSWERNNLIHGDATSVLLRRNLVTGATAALNGNFARNNLPIPDGWIHDEWFAILAALHERLHLHPEPLTLYRQHSNNVIGVSKRDIRELYSRAITRDTADDLRRLTRAKSLCAYLEDNRDISPENLVRLHEAVSHQICRSTLPAKRYRRLPSIAKELLSGRYNSYSRGPLTMFHDLFSR